MNDDVQQLRDEYKRLRATATLVTGLTNSEFDHKVKSSLSLFAPQTPAAFVKAAKAILDKTLKAEMKEEKEEAKELPAGIATDTGYTGGNQGRCYQVYHRTVSFLPDVPRSTMQQFVDAERAGWYGQEFSADFYGQTVIIRRAVDSGD